ncbi:hypothetical protein JHK85_002407 [Glycine max]|nr:hypothetical protein JHK85_002407 [Glycine max]KAG5089733.1 hypothetical protein JHK86_002345 [Glycine max]
MSNYWVVDNVLRLYMTAYTRTIVIGCATPVSFLVLRRLLLLCTFPNGDLFWSINGIAAPDLTLVYIPEGCHVDIPIHLDYMHPPNTTTDAMQLSNPRFLVVVEKGAQANIIEEFSALKIMKMTLIGVMPAFEAVIGEGAKLTHSYIQTQSFRSAHIKWTSFLQFQPSSIH